MFLRGSPASPPSRFILLLILVAATIASCTAFGTTEIASSTPSLTATPPLPAPTSTPTPITGKVIFFDSDQTFPDISQPISSALLELARSQGWEFITSEERPVHEFEPGTRLVAVLPPDPGLQTISNEYPDIQFLAIGISGLQPSPNLSMIGPHGFREDRIAFIAGVISAVITKDWRVGIINQAPSESVELIHQSFSNGVVYYCGMCQLTYPPFYDYPILTSLSPEATEPEWTYAIDLLISKAVKTVFIHSNEFDSAALERLPSNDIKMLGYLSPPIGLQNSWVVTIRMAPEDIIQNHWDDLVAQRGGWAEEIPITLENVNDNLLTPGKQRWVQEVINDVIHGYIETGAFGGEDLQ